MSKTLHSLYIASMVIVTMGITAYIAYTGYEYYSTPLEERYYLSTHDWFKPSGLFGHGLGIVGTFLILFGVVIYIMRKRYNFLGKFIRLKYLLEFHIFLCTLGPIMILFHTAFKFGGIVSVAFWSMVAVVLSGVVGRFIYIQIPRTIEGRELSLKEVQAVKEGLSEKLQQQEHLNDEMKDLLSSFSERQKEKKPSFQSFFDKRKTIKAFKKMLRSQGARGKERKHILDMMKEEMNLAGRIERLNKMQGLFKYWHVAHLPFALIMLIIVVLHVGVTLAFGYTWIF